MHGKLLKLSSIEIVPFKNKIKNLRMVNNTWVFIEVQIPIKNSNLFK